ncbi:uncharacterized protein BO80DRAFT_273950 [Aspergillus ibericus CBS 121593]|uniref:Mediator of RNA polymerase II transcription subunit 4 n=1 Tax=Aspergillus ibericus CBS 121593 TaxID=1448316 RepID=A0A395HAG0_9EURO|nr:hypothetical protein BO80DRAFT_273950 [Aspergillus ibericus CBS 121593]RAL03908.1 hypothetical protein BO80DRAFT_273950 [Aspergillus ibericus CBS 121593]
MNVEFQGSLFNLENKLNVLITSLTTSPTAAGAPAAAVGLLDADDSLTSAVETLRQHQQNYAKLLRLREEAQALEEKVKSIVREVVAYEKEIRTTCGDDEESDSDLDCEDDSSDNDLDEDTSGDKPRSGGIRGIKEVDYKLLLDFARRISKYNHQAAADAAANAEARSREKLQDKGPDSDIMGANGNTDEAAEPVATVTKEATSWLDESANMTRQAYMLPYPMEDRIRMGLMAQIQIAAAEGRSGFDPEKEVERLIREAEGVGIADAVPPVDVGEGARHADEAAKAAAHAGSAATSGPTMGAALAPKPKATLDLDLYDPDEDDE